MQCCGYAREAALESAVLQCCHVLIFKALSCCFVVAHKDRHLGVNKVVCRGYEIYEILFWCYKTKHVGVVVFFCAYPRFLLFLFL